MIDSKNDYEYLLFEDMKAAGFEPVDVQQRLQRQRPGRLRGVPRRTASPSSCRTLARGKHSVSYRLRAEIPGKFSALPTRLGDVRPRAEGQLGRAEAADRGRPSPPAYGRCAAARINCSLPDRRHSLAKGFPMPAVAPEEVLVVPTSPSTPSATSKASRPT